MMSYVQQTTLSRARYACPAKNQKLKSEFKQVNVVPSWALRRQSICICQSTTSNGSQAMQSSIEGVLFDMDGVLCNSEIPSREAACMLFKELYDLDVTPEEFVPFAGTGEVNFLGGVANLYGVPFDGESAKARFFEIYIGKYAQPGAGIGYPGARELIELCKQAGLKTAVASSADRVKVDANLLAAGIPQDLFDTIVSADRFERLKPAPDIFLTGAKELGLSTDQCLVIEDAAAGVQAARAAGMKVLGVTTTLSAEQMKGENPDGIFDDISKISLNEILSVGAPVQANV
eukprot:TRINITY_DN587_c1_g2_i1.p2 TRINITY_DN587_c1_g2~~TRINITY_DN587_c1_g2_i1.p2  ORF type:complete len:317 (-),score=45.92 TRINITY_DN587_c1_g2_i1:230-1096(-)